MTNKRKALQIAIDRLNKHRCEYEFIESMLKTAFEDGDVIEYKGERWHVIGFYVAEHTPYVQMVSDDEMLVVRAESLTASLEKTYHHKNPIEKIN